MRKESLLRKIIERLTENFAVFEKAARFAQAEATHESSKAENKYDTRGLEASYLAGGQSRQAKEIAEALKTYEALNLKDFTANDPIDLTALVELETEGDNSFYFVGPKAGGVEILHQGKEITVITPQSPLGQALMGRKQGERWKITLGGRAVKYHAVSVT